MSADPPVSTTRPNWSAIHDERESWRRKLIGAISEAFVIPRYVKLFYDTFGAASQHDFCEIGSGNGDMSRAILSANTGTIRRYATSEVFPEGVAWLHSQGLESVQADAEALGWSDAEFYGSVEFDVMHHVDHPRAMAREMMRVAQGQCLLVESNGLSIFRRIKELTPGHRAAGEKSYTPWQYRSFFNNHPGYELTDFRIAPFLFPFKCPPRLLPLLIWFNRVIERVPLVNWQCSSVWIQVRYRRVGE